jgi:hypothetical protein
MIGPQDGDRAGFSWESPRWREPEAALQGVVEHDRRLWDTPAPAQSGAIDDDLTIVHGARSRRARRRIRQTRLRGPLGLVVASEQRTPTWITLALGSLRPPRP